MSLQLEPRTREFYRRAMSLLKEAGVPFLVGGAYAMERYTEIERHTVRTVDIIPRQSSLNINDIQETVKATGILASFKFLFGFAGQVRDCQGINTGCAQRNRQLVLNYILVFRDGRPTGELVLCFDRTASHDDCAAHPLGTLRRQ